MQFFFTHSLSKEVSDIKKMNIANNNKNISAITPLLMKSWKNC